MSPASFNHPIPIGRAATLAATAYDTANFRDRETDTEALAVLSCIAIRGTEADMRDIRRDINVGLVEIDGAYLHAGFLESARVLLPLALDRLKNDALTLGRLDLIGHSLGGAIAMALAYLLPVGTVRSITTFGAPRAGDDVFAQRVAEKVSAIVRVTNAGDIIPTVPWAITGYRHAGERLYLTEKGHWWNPTIVERAWMRLFAGHTIIGAHKMETYLERLKKFGF